MLLKGDHKIKLDKFFGNILPILTATLTESLSHTRKMAESRLIIFSNEDLF